MSDWSSDVCSSDLINTPLAIVRSSLDNLPAEEVPAHARTYLERARSGVDRLGLLVRAMSEATRIEQALANVEPEHFDLAGLLRECGEAYRSLLAQIGRATCRESVCQDG